MYTPNIKKKNYFKLKVNAKVVCLRGGLLFCETGNIKDFFTLDIIKLISL